MCTRVLTAALLTVTRRQRLPKYPLEDERVKEMQSLLTAEQLSLEEQGIQTRDEPQGRQVRYASHENTDVAFQPTLRHVWPVLSTLCNDLHENGIQR